MKKRKSSIAALCLCLALSGKVNAASCPPYAELISMASVAAAKTAMEALFQQLVNAFLSQLNMFAQMKIGAVKVATTQVSLAAKMKIKSDQSLLEGETAARALLASTQAQARLFESFSPQTGQGVNPCVQLGKQRIALAAAANVLNEARVLVEAAAAAPGRFGNSTKALEAVLRTRYAQFGTKDEEALGLARASTATITTATGETVALAGADSNAKTFFADSADPLIEQARMNAMNYLAGRPDAPLTKEQASTGAGISMLEAKMNKDAVMSVGLNAIATVASENTPNHELGVSMSKSNADMVNMYFGDSAKDMWVGWLSQSERGLMVDQLKMQAALLKLDYDRLQQLQRQEALFSVLLADRAREMQKDVALSAHALNQQTLKSPIR